MVAAARGVYGFRITGLDEGARFLPPVPESWPHLHVEITTGAGNSPEPAGTVRVRDDGAEMWLADGGRIEMSRSPMQVRFMTPQPISTDAVLHPFLGLPAAIANHWLGRFCLHGGAFVHRERAWAVLGDREAGKSATLAYLLKQGHPILTDDILIIDGKTVFSGPRSVDLREDAAGILGGDAVGVIGTRQRWRLRPGAAEPAMPLAGMVQLEWGPTPSLEPLTPEARLRALVASAAIRPGTDQASELLELAALPAWRFVRPRSLQELGSLAGQLLTELAASV